LGRELGLIGVAAKQDVSVSVIEEKIYVDDESIHPRKFFEKRKIIIEPV